MRHAALVLACLLGACTLGVRVSYAQSTGRPLDLTIAEESLVTASALMQQTPSPTTAMAPVSSPQSHTDVMGAIGDSFKLLAIEHALRIGFQEKTRKELGGPFWLDYVHSVRVPRQWQDTDAWYVNYIGHPIHGAAAGYNWLDHGPDGAVPFGRTSRYWSAKGRATAWAAGYSLQFEIGPVSEASIGNVGKRPETTGWVDHVVTPLGAFGLMVAEDALDRFLVEWAETRVSNKMLRATMRIAFNPARALSNGATGRAPWHRDGRPLDWRGP